MFVVLSAAAPSVNVPRITRKRQRGNCNLSKYPQAALMYGAWILLLICPYLVGLMPFIRAPICLLKPSASNRVFVGEGRLTARDVATLFFNGVVRTYGLPKAVLHDRDPRFTSNFWRCLWELMGVLVALSYAHHP